MPLVETPIEFGSSVKGHWRSKFEWKIQARHWSRGFQKSVEVDAWTFDEAIELAKLELTLRGYDVREFELMSVVATRATGEGTWSR